MSVYYQYQHSLIPAPRGTRGGVKTVTNHSNRRRYYAAQSPRGFSNEVDVYIFSSLAHRNAWVEEHRHDGDANSAYCGAYTVTKQEALRLGGCAIDGRGFPVPGTVNGTFVR